MSFGLGFPTLPEEVATSLDGYKELGSMFIEGTQKMAERIHDSIKELASNPLAQELAYCIAFNPPVAWAILGKELHNKIRGTQIAPVAAVEITHAEKIRDAN